MRLRTFDHLLLRAHRRYRTMRGMTDNELRELTTGECHDLLGRHHFGRLAFLDPVEAMPTVIPVNYLFHEGDVVFRTDPGSKLTAALHQVPVAFEVDDTDEEQRLGWSVVVHGHLEEVTESSRRDALSATPLAAWAPGPKAHYVRVNAQQVTGRRIRMPDLPSHWWG